MIATKTKTKTKTCNCNCDCGGVCTACSPQLYERPRYFAGQLLTEAELNSEQTYMLAKQRLHNRYLHGKGVVCGLQVVCHKCDGWVTVEPGYAIDPCGRDIVVCNAHDFDLLDAILQCKREEKKSADCRDRKTYDDCEDAKQTWCIVLRYAEEQLNPTTPLLRRSNGCSTGNGVTSSATCEPTRVRETYTLDVIPAPCCAESKWYDFDFSNDNWTETAEALLGSIFSCVFNFAEYMQDQTEKKKSLQQSLSVMLAFALSQQNGTNNDQIDPAELVRMLDTACYDVRCFLQKLFQVNPLGNPVVCPLEDRLARIYCVPPPQISDNEVDFDEFGRYVEIVQNQFRAMTDMLFEYVIECFCRKLLPPCADEPEDDYLILACVDTSIVTAKGKQAETVIDRISNFCCREHAGAFPSTRHWLSLVPLWTFVGERLKSFCCDPDILGLFGINDFDLTSFGRMASGYGTNIGQMVTKATTTLNTDYQAASTNAVVMNDLHASTIDEAVAILHDHHVEIVEVHEVESREALAAADIITAPVFANKGDRLIAFRDPAGKTVGFKRATAASTTEVVKLRSELDELRAELNAMRPKGTKS